MKVIILAAGQGTRLRPLTDEYPKCMVKINGKSIIDRQVETIKAAGIREEQIYVVTGYRSDVLRQHFIDTGITCIENEQFKTTNMVCSLMCAEKIMEEESDIIISYGDIIYEIEVFNKILNVQNPISVIVDDGWYEYWCKRCENPLDDAETLVFDENHNLLEIGQKTDNLSRIQAQYIGLMHFRGQGLSQLLITAKEAKRRTEDGKRLWRTDRNYQKMYMTDLLQGLIDEHNELKAVHINRGWFEIDNRDDLIMTEEQLRGERNAAW